MRGQLNKYCGNTMKTFKITLSTNFYQASRNSLFSNGKTTTTCISGLSYEQAKSKLKEFANNDYPYAREVESTGEFIKEFISNPHFFENIDKGSEDEYFEATKKRQLFLYTKKQDLFFKFEGSGLYENGAQKVDYSNDYYNCGGYVFAIVEETEEDSE